MLGRKRQDRSLTPATTTSLIAKGMVVYGDLHFSGMLHLDGRIEGAVEATDEDAVFTLSEHGQVCGNVHVPHAVINGEVQGDVLVSRRLELAAMARVTGDVHYHTLEMAAGAKINGRMTHRPEIAGHLPAPDDAAAEPADSATRGACSHQ